MRNKLKRRRQSVGWRGKEKKESEIWQGREIEREKTKGKKKGMEREKYKREKD